MGIGLEVNGRRIEADKGETILSALNRHGLHVPTICTMKNLSPSGACRMCVVEVEGSENLVPACSFPVENELKIQTHSPRVLRARKTNVELLLSNHPDDCLYCERNGSCELQTLSEDLNIRERRIPGKKSPFRTDRSSPAIVRDPSKCILCGRCVRICEELMATSALDFAHRGNELRISTTLEKALNYSSCISCGQCLNACPTGALIENVQFQDLEPHIHSGKETVVVQYSPAVAVSVSEMLGCKTGYDMSGTINAVLRRYGFNFVFDTSMGTELMIMEQASIFEQRKKENGPFPLITSSCPAWVQYVEQQYPELIPLLSPLKSPQQILGSLIREWLPEIIGRDGKEIISVVISSCTAAKSEARKVEMTSSGLPLVDFVLTTRELARIIRLSGIDLNQLEPEGFDSPFSSPSTAGKLAGTAGGEVEASMRTLYYKHTGKDMTPARLHRFRIQKYFREMSVKAGSEDINMAMVSGLANARPVLENILSGKKTPDILEVMACPDGCVNGGGQPIPANELILRSRSRAIYDMDNGGEIQAAHQNPVLKKIYDEYLGEPAGKKSRKLLYTHFTERKELL